jgi:hypothetical protein
MYTNQVLNILAHWVMKDRAEIQGCIAYIKALHTSISQSACFQLGYELIALGEKEQCCRLLLQTGVDTRSEPALHTLLHATESAIEYRVDGPGEYLEMDPHVSVLWVNTSDALTTAYERLAVSTVIGIDVCTTYNNYFICKL